MASLLRQIVAGPRARHPEAKLDLCYVTDYIIATSGPSSSYPTLAYRNPLSELTRFLDLKHGVQWAIWEFRAEGTGYDDDAVHGRISHFPWPDHHPPPFALMPRIVASMREWLHEGDAEAHKGKGGAAGDHRVAVVHCKAGKGRSGTATVSYLISEEGWDKEEAKENFTKRRMRPGFGNGLSIPSQVRWINYVERWARIGGKRYAEQSVEITEVHVWGMRDGVKIAIEGFIDAGKRINNFHTFEKKEGYIANNPGGINSSSSLASNKGNGAGRSLSSSRSSQSNLPISRGTTTDSGVATPRSSTSLASTAINNPSIKDSNSAAASENGSDTVIKPAPARQNTPSMDVVYRPSQRIILPSLDVNLAVERRTRSGYMPAMVTSIAHAWFNCFFEGRGPERYQAWREALPISESAHITLTSQLPAEAQPESSGVFQCTWEDMDGIKGSSRKGKRAFDRIAVVWRVIPESEHAAIPSVEVELAPPLDTNQGPATIASLNETNSKGKDQLIGDEGKKTVVPLKDLVEGNLGGDSKATSVDAAPDESSLNRLGVPLSETLQVDSDEEIDGLRADVSMPLDRNKEHDIVSLLPKGQ